MECSKTIIATGAKFLHEHFHYSLFLRANKHEIFELHTNEHKFL
jgi:hypothetical protein